MAVKKSKSTRLRTVPYPDKVIARLDRIHQAYAAQWYDQDGVRCPKIKTWNMVMELGCIAAEQQLGLKHQ